MLSFANVSRHFQSNCRRSDDTELPSVDPKKAFINGALEKEIRLSFAQRIRGTLPEPYLPLVSESQDKDTPDFKYDPVEAPYGKYARDIHRLLRGKAPEAEVQEQIDSIEAEARANNVSEPQLVSTDAYMTSICFLGSKSLSHVLSCIERCKERLLNITSSSDSGRRQIITSVMGYWQDRPGVGVNIVDKLLNYTILTPMSIVEWALVSNLGGGKILAQAHVFEMVASTVSKVSIRIRQITTAHGQNGLPEDQIKLLDTALVDERNKMQELFSVLEHQLKGVAENSNDAMIEGVVGNGADGAQIRSWGQRWLRTFRRKLAVEEAWLQQTMAEQQRQMEEALLKQENGNGYVGNIEEEATVMQTDETS